MFTKRKNDFDYTAKRVFSSRDGLMLLKYLKEDFLNRSVRAKTTEDTYYNIGQQDFVKRLLKSLPNEADLDKVTTQVNIDDTLEGTV